MESYKEEKPSEQISLILGACAQLQYYRSREIDAQTTAALQAIDELAKSVRSFRVYMRPEDFKLFIKFVEAIDMMIKRLYEAHVEPHFIYSKIGIPRFKETTWKKD